VFANWYAKAANRTWWHHLVGVPGAILLMVLWLRAEPVHPWPGLIGPGVLLICYAALAIRSYRHGRRHPDDEAHRL
jgi:hypothetical protein